MNLLVRFILVVLRPIWYRAVGNYHLSRVGSCGSDVRIHGPVTINHPERLAIGSHTRIGTGCFLMCNGGVDIGENVQMSRNITIYSANHDVEGAAIPYDDTYVCKKVTVGDSVWIGMNVSILPGVTIGEGAIIGMSTVVTKDVPPYAVVVGAGQRVVKYRDADHFETLKGQGKFFGKLWPNR